MRLQRGRNLTSVLTVLLMMVSLGGTSFAAGPDPAKVSAMLKVGGGAVGGVGYVSMIAMSTLVKERFPRIDMTVVPGGWVGNMTRTDTQEMDIGSTAIAMANLVKDHKPPFEKPLPNIRSLINTQDTNYLGAFVRKDFPADTLEELFQKKIPAKLCTLYVGNYTELAWRELFQYHNTTWDDVANKWGGKINFVPWPDAVNLVKDGHADGILSSATLRIGWALELATSRPVKMLKWSKAELEHMRQSVGMDAGTIPANTYTGIAEDVMCATVTGMAVIHKDVPNEVVEAILISMWEGADKMAQQHAGLAKFTREGMCKDILAVPLHPAAEKFFREKGCLK